ncbi:putative leucine-rich repeat-containing, plant-type, leucine-rich repeat domain superfamily [Helianthus annuus]|uniref:Leucine-rich repeat-containing, plant-type, leucine-rich repeat domain superfamily n=1 Tax=Helianthus annuus TaxID=4232 RepID=A0A251TGD8_HELAN|nr:receptor-like protein EIX2 [Helianthus annuus]KAF5784822.1 putative leucine-rich repeat-containing, plant-type, leucine-rich repeat domain superfamily [Helianthus annuus]KAJ0528595.1 putative leucine-rich repeat-containing, plant-type, leucine-rich repeat domain superfamily [Helianthus annuus]KAJ0698981.1 putative leucine-rich repeat-containing, plant-type, leucine-rich repeat domain superfamily [Helianthus annuus]KAJ0877916.1 putative leucine-rich repeat-containing, plant-type, leucine-rich
MRGLGIHFLFVTIFLVATTNMCLGARNITLTCFEQERLALLKFKHSVRGGYDMFSSWVGHDCCSWERVSCDGVTRNVISLHLEGAGGLKHYFPYHFNRRLSDSDEYLVSNELSTSLGELSHLRYLDLSGNDFLGSRIPEFIGSLKQLTYLNLSFANLSGIISHHIGNLSNLKNLDLSFNHLTGSIPESFESLGGLEILDISSNDLTGPIPTFSEKLIELDLSSNYLNGSIPKSLRKLIALEVLHLDNNELTGPIPTFPGKVTKLYLSANYLSGSIPESIGKLADLTDLYLSNNLLSGTIPVSTGQLSKLRSLDVSGNLLEGVVFESHFANLSMMDNLNAAFNSKLMFSVSRKWLPPFQLIRIDLSSCKITNGFPNWLRNQKKLISLAFSNATISRPLPTWLRSMPIIPSIDLSHNNLSGPLTNLPNGGTYHGNLYPELFLQNNLFNESIPRSLCKRTDLYYLDLSRNKLTGKLPNCLKNLLKLCILSLSSNGLSGAVPSFIGHMSSLMFLKLNNNSFSDELPQKFWNLSSLIILDLGDNAICGKLPEWIGEKVKSLRTFRLHKNNFTGEIPRSLCLNTDLRILDIAHNKITGTIPHCLGELQGMVNNRMYISFGDDTEGVIQVMKGTAMEYTKTMQYVFNMDLSSNKLVGDIPVELTALYALVGLNLSNNHLSGRIPDNIGNMKALFSLDLSGNKLSGLIPPSIAALHFLSHLNLSNNNLSGQIPTGDQLQTLIDPSIYAGNKHLCGAPLPENCSNHEDRTATPKNKYKAANKLNKVLFGLDLACGFATGFWGFIVVLVLKKRWRHKLFMFSEETVDKIHVAVMVRVTGMMRGNK